MNWYLSNRADPRAVEVADRHYNRQKPGTKQFVPPGRCLVLWRPGCVWVTSWPFAEYVKHAWAGAWVNSCSRREKGPRPRKLIRQAVAATRWYWGEPPEIGMITFIDRNKVKSKQDYGYTYLCAGFVIAGETKGGLLALQLWPEEMPPAEAPRFNGQ